MSDYYLTFGVGQPHPEILADRCPPGRHLDGWVRIVAPDEWVAREIAAREFGQQWSLIYHNELEVAWFPRGELLVLDSKGVAAE